jgi:hypothetical protein
LVLPYNKQASVFLAITLPNVLKSLALILKYTLKPYREHQRVSNSAATANHLQCQFDVGSKQQIAYGVGQYKTAD